MPAAAWNAVLTATADAWAREVLERQGATAWLLWLGCTREGYQHFCRVYGYFRWADDHIDAPDRDPEAVKRFAADQLARLGQPKPDSRPEQALAASWNDPVWGPRLQPVIRGMWRALEADAQRTPEPISSALLDDQTRWIGDAYLDALWHCSGAPNTPPPAVYWLSRAATMVHTVRDLEEDLQLGYCNVPLSSGCHHDGTTLTPERAAPWMRERLSEALAAFRRGRSALPRVRRRRTRWLLWLFAWRYERKAQELLRALNAARLDLDSAA